MGNGDSVGSDGGEPVGDARRQRSIGFAAGRGDVPSAVDVQGPRVRRVALARLLRRQPREDANIDLAQTRVGFIAVTGGAQGFEYDPHGGPGAAERAGDEAGQGRAVEGTPQDQTADTSLRLAERREG